MAVPLVGILPFSDCGDLFFDHAVEIFLDEQPYLFERFRLITPSKSLPVFITLWAV